MRTADPKKKDELKGAFRSLEGDCSKFLSRPQSQRASVIRFCLLPFLNKHASHPSNTCLRPEDVEYRCTILNKWWMGLLETLQTSNIEALSGVDRSTIHDAIDGIMGRPEWRFPQESRIQDTFIQNVFAQLEYVVERMSLKNAPAGLVTFCGKSCAYAFFFCPMAAEILVRLWDVPVGTFKRLLRALGLAQPWNFCSEAESIIGQFPSYLRPLAFCSPTAAVTALRKRPQLTPDTHKPKWRDHQWLARWSGRKSQLFYTFVEHYHVYLDVYLPVSATQRSRIASPGYALVYAQLLSNLDTIIRRPSSTKSTEHNQGPIGGTFDDILGANASASSLSSSPAISTRLMTENRIIILLRDFLSFRSPPYPARCQTFARNFCDLLRESVRTTSLYDHSACFTLCDLMQEVSVVLGAFERSALLSEPLIDWNFWIGVFKLMVRSESTLSEIRLYALLFTLWPIISSKKNLMEDICYNLLLEEAHFSSRFNHWCPLVRSYYMRLLCWRIARFNGDARDWELSVLETLSTRLQSVWGQYKYRRDEAIVEDTLLPSTAPCNPVPMRRLLIIRTDIPTALGLLAFQERLGPPTFPGDLVAAEAPSSDNSPFSAAQLLQKLSLTLESTEEPQKKKSSLFRSIIGIGSPKSRSRPQSPAPSSPRSSKESSREPSRNASPERSSRASLYEQRPTLLTSPSTESITRRSRADKSPARKPIPSAYREGSFKFSLEVETRASHTAPQDVDLQPPRLPLAAHQYLESCRGYIADGPTSKPCGLAVASSRYAGRALAEWSIVVNECQNFFERRRHEGVPSNRLVETPTLGVDSLRKPM